MYIYQLNKASSGASGNYWINTTTGVHQVYCDMELECGGHKGGWMRIAELNTTREDDYPSGWTKIATNDAVHPDERASQENCPCASSPGKSAYAFISNDYYCESGSLEP